MIQTARESHVILGNIIEDVDTTKARTSLRMSSDATHDHSRTPQGTDVEGSSKQVESLQQPKAMLSGTLMAHLKRNKDTKTV